ncbi:hypothetical protein DFR58_101318 [Anaerobacterium chartisolvens]|uniref:Radical SAM superfamily enzyme YgiQ (UPF0313 family) n=1 Tax=Anaerobacterium chartisolvens TaxID=1297424 RepID=A0A369BKH6_9FIRM|nr:cobalamin-binding domain-containing protein [Anaerobacterium chartisolvens]RCX21108.1 hypothetical protein DFR58_101318 [Anaerobacterium chartisolvens]
MSNILLIEPSYRNKYPPLALMKISTYHKLLGDTVIFCKGKNTELKNRKWDRIYITTLFTFHWNPTIDTIEYYQHSVNNISDIYCGGVLATVLHDDLIKKFPVTVTPGLLNRAGILGNDEHIVDTLPPDYSIIDMEKNTYLKYSYPLKNAYIAYATRGCIRKCPFCAVPTIEPCFSPYIDIKQQIDYIRTNFGEMKDLVLLDNNVLASENFNEIIDDIKKAGFYKGACLEYKKNGRTIRTKRYVDFNQGIDARLLTKNKCKKLSEIAIKPLRIAFDHADKKSVDLYKAKIRMAASYGIEHLSNYVLFNFEDSPEDLYNRLLVNADLNEEFREQGSNSRIFSFPMKYSPVRGTNSLDRKYIGVKWNKKYLRAVQCILNATHGVVGPKKEFFHRAFGRNLEEFLLILSMPEDMIINRSKYERAGITDRWREDFSRLSEDSEQYYFIHNKDLKTLNFSESQHNILSYYISVQ